MAICPCNKREEITTGRLGEIQCNSLADAQEVSHEYLSSTKLVTTEVNSNGVKCDSAFVDPEQELKRNQLPLKLAQGTILPFEDSVSYEVSWRGLLEIQLNTNELRLTQEVTNVECDIHFVKLTGCYSCLSGASFFLQGNTLEGTTTATLKLECPQIGYFTAFHVTPNLTTYQLVLKSELPDVDTPCILKCSDKNYDLKINGHLQYLQNMDVRTFNHIFITGPPNTWNFNGFL